MTDKRIQLPQFVYFVAEKTMAVFYSYNVKFFRDYNKIVVSHTLSYGTVFFTVVGPSTNDLIINLTKIRASTGTKYRYLSLQEHNNQEPDGSNDIHWMDLIGPYRN